MLTAAAGMLAIATGMAVAWLPAFGFLLLGVLLLVAAAVRLHPCSIACAAIMAPWASRLVTAPGYAPRLLDFVDVPLAVGAFLLALVYHTRSGEPPSQPARLVLAAIGVCFAVMCAAWLVNLTSPVRLVAAAVLLLAPFLVVATFLLAPPPPRLSRWIVGALLTVAIVQIVAGTAQFLGGARHDEIQGTLIGAGAGAHVTSAAAILLLFVALASSASIPLKGSIICGALWLAVAADAKQVLYLVPIGLLGFVWAAPSGGSAVRRRRPGLRALLYFAAVTVGVVFVALRFTAAESARGFVEQTTGDRGGKVALIDTMIEDLTRNPADAALGYGPGETVSRFAFLTTPLLLKEGSPVEALGLRPGEHTLRYHERVQASTPLGGSSSVSAQSSALGLLGDYGLLGLCAFAVLIAFLLQLLVTSSHWLAPAALGGWLMLIPLAFILDWLEQPPFMFLLAGLTGVALGHTNPSRRLDPVRANPSTTW